MSLLSGSNLSLCAIAVLGVWGCTTSAQVLDSMEPPAMDVAVKRGQFELNCPQAKGTVLSRQLFEPAVMGPRMMGIARAEYTIGVSGCDKRSTYVVICPDDGSGCFAAQGRGGNILRE